MNEIPHRRPFFAIETGNLSPEQGERVLRMITQGWLAFAKSETFLKAEPKSVEDAALLGFAMGFANGIATEIGMLGDLIALKSN